MDKKLPLMAMAAMLGVMGEISFTPSGYKRYYAVHKKPRAERRRLRKAERQRKKKGR